jgi:transketolase
MRSAFCSALVAQCAKQKFIFFTGDLGFAALEPLRQAMGERFINAGIAEQNMVSVAAGAANFGEQCWVYSIAPFIYGRPFEQIRNDVCGHGADVKLIGNGGGFSYGVMGATHHALEDYGVLCTLRNMHVYVPAFAKDVAPIITLMSSVAHPSYLRLGRCEIPSGFVPPAYTPWRRLLPGALGIMVVVGPAAGGLLAEALSFDEQDRPEIWVVGEVPIAAADLPAEFLSRLKQSGLLSVMEEHVEQGGVGQMLALLFLQMGIQLRRFRHFHARGYPSGRYGSQSFHRAENGLDPRTVIAEARRFALA